MNGKVRIIYWLGPLLAILCASCASVISGPSQTIEINANVPGVGVYDQGKYLGTTPLRVDVARQNNLVLSLERKGYVTRNLTLKSRTNGNVWWNLPFTVLGLTGISTDYGSGAVYEYSPSRFYVIMKPVKTAVKDGIALDEFGFLASGQIEKERARHQSGPYLKTLEHLKVVNQ